MSFLEIAVTEPIAISKVAGRYLLFDIDIVTYLRRKHNICGVLIGGIPQAPQQNVLNGLPIQLSPEEVRLLVEKNVAYIVDDLTFHKDKFSTLTGSEKKQYLESLRKMTRSAEKKAASEAEKRVKHGLKLKAMNQASNARSKEKAKVVDEEDSEVTLFGSDESNWSASPSPSTMSPQASLSFTVTPTTTPLSSPADHAERNLPVVPVSYPLFAYLHAQNYFITPGLRFGCDYNVYPGDQLRFHSHFLAVGHTWDQSIPLMDIVSGGRLGTGVKKGYLIGGKDPKSDIADASAGVRTFCIEWGGM